MNDKQTEREIDETPKATFPSSNPPPWSDAQRGAPAAAEERCDKAKRRPPKHGEDERC